MKKCTWIIQTNMALSEVEKYTEACEKLGYPYIHFKQIPFNTVLPVDLKVDYPCIFIGSTTVVELAKKEYPLSVFFSDLLFSPRSYQLHYGSDYLNSDQVILKVKELKNYLNLPANKNNKQYFVKCNNDSKQIPGQIKTAEELVNLANITDSYYDSYSIFTPDSEVILAEPKCIDDEYRLVIVNKKVISGSQYKLRINSDVPSDIIDFAEKLANVWVPDDVFVMDICTINNELKVVECNCFNASGLYKSNTELIVKAVSEHAEREFSAYQHLLN